MTSATIGAAALWIVREIWGYVRTKRATAAIASAVDIGKAAAAVIAKLAREMHMDTEQLIGKLRDKVRTLAALAGLSAAQVEKAQQVAVRELGRILLEDAFEDFGDKLEKTFPGGKVP